MYYVLRNSKKGVSTNIVKTVEGSTLTIALAGKLNATASQQLDAELRQSLDGITDLIFDFTELEYITSAGLRVLLFTQQLMNTRGSMKVRNVNSEILNIFDMTGFSTMLTIE